VGYSKRVEFDAYPHKLIIKSGLQRDFLAKLFPHKDGMHNKISPKAIVTLS